MKAKKKELSVDYIGGQGPLTIVEEQELHEYFTKQKVDSKKVKSKGSAKKVKQLKVITWSDDFAFSTGYNIGFTPRRIWQPRSFVSFSRFLFFDIENL